MKTGDNVTDSQKRVWTLGQLLGRGVWGKSWLVRDENGEERVLKVALEGSDFPADASLPKNALSSCRKCAEEQIELLESLSNPHLPKLEDHFTLPKGRPALLFPRYPCSLETQLARELPLQQLMQIILDVTRALENTGTTHGNLRLSNILLNDRGDVVLTDALTPATQKIWGRLVDLSPGRTLERPAEADTTIQGQWDTWALCHIIYQAISYKKPDGPNMATITDALRTRGLDKSDLLTVKESALSQLKQSGTNTRFQIRVTQKLGTILNRGLSLEATPSPPYRFENASVFRPRLEETVALLSPRVEEVGQVLLSASAKDGVFTGETAVALSVTVACTPGVTDHEDVTCGIQLDDMDAENESRVAINDARFHVKRHPSGRLRFEFTLQDVQPGRYQVRVAFSIKDSGNDPTIATGTFEMRPAPGYIPPSETPEITPALPFPSDMQSEDGPTTGFGGMPTPLPAPQTQVGPPTPIPPISLEQARPTTSGQVEPNNFFAADGVATPITQLGEPDRDELLDQSMDTTPDDMAPQVPLPEETVLDPPTKSEESSKEWDLQSPIPLDELDDHSTEIFSHTDHQDLPNWEALAKQRTRLGKLNQKINVLIELARKDTYTMLVASVTVVFMTILILTTILRACNTAPT